MLLFAYFLCVAASDTTPTETHNMNISDKIASIQQAVSQFGFAASVASNDLIVIKNKKNQIVASVTDQGVEQKYAGAKNLCGALVRNAINSAIA